MAKPIDFDAINNPKGARGPGTPTVAAAAAGPVPPEDSTVREEPSALPPPPPPDPPAPQEVLSRPDRFSWLVGLNAQQQAAILAVEAWIHRGGQFSVVLDEAHRAVDSLRRNGVLTT